MELCKKKQLKEGNFGISCGIPWLHILSTILHLKLNDPWKIKHVGSGPWKPPLALVTKQYMATDFRQLKLLQLACVCIYTACFSLLMVSIIGRVCYILDVKWMELPGSLGCQSGQYWFIICSRGGKMTEKKDEDFYICCTTHFIVCTIFHCTSYFQRCPTALTFGSLPCFHTFRAQVHPFRAQVHPYMK